MPECIRISIPDLRCGYFLGRYDFILNQITILGIKPNENFTADKKCKKEKYLALAP
jgi:hypothetical protein